MKIYIEITNQDGLDAHGFIAVIHQDESETLIPISMPLESLATALEAQLITAIENHPKQSTLFYSKA